MEKANFKTTIRRQYASPQDEELGIPPLFCVQYEVTEIDTERIKSVDEIGIAYTLREKP